MNDHQILMIARSLWIPPTFDANRRPIKQGYVWTDDEILAFARKMIEVGQNSTVAVRPELEVARP